MRTVLKVTNDNAGWNVIRALRTEAKAYNLREKAASLLDPNYKAVYKRVVLFGRLGKNNPNRSKYAKRPGSWRNPAQRIALADAAEIAIYINPMKKYVGSYGTNYNLTSQPFNVHL